ncbi:hypothetical protein CDAR_303301 [Caerostris darwini]|uniref:Uncharacterized protein n=1 Tax=Caerostris darwini TaxID=1538125 RepID=A0AAV4R4B0_9ARAC|nr:hypothetical protein CDAR_303301 [Caerostris darwini]
MFEDSVNGTVPVVGLIHLPLTGEIRHPEISHSADGIRKMEDQKEAEEKNIKRRKPRTNKTSSLEEKSGRLPNADETEILKTFL